MPWSPMREASRASGAFTSGARRYPYTNKSVPLRQDQWYQGMIVGVGERKGEGRGRGVVAGGERWRIGGGGGGGQNREVKEGKEVDQEYKRTRRQKECWFQGSGRSGRGG